MSTFVRPRGNSASFTNCCLIPGTQYARTSNTRVRALAGGGSFSDRVGPGLDILVFNRPRSKSGALQLTNNTWASFGKQRPAAAGQRVP